MEEEPIYFIGEMNKDIPVNVSILNNSEFVIQTITEKPLGLLSFNFDMNSQDDAKFFRMKCQRILFKFGGEHAIDQLKGDLDLIIDCTDQDPYQSLGRSRIVMVVVRFKFSNGDETQTTAKFFDDFEKIDKIPFVNGLNVNNLNEFLNEFTISDGVLGYLGNIIYFYIFFIYIFII
jgi:hypothetical protein